MSLTKQTLLVVADGISTVLNSGIWDLHIGTIRLRGNRYTLAILDAFATPRTLEDALKEITRELAATPAWVEVVANVKAFHELGILVQPDAGQTARRSHASRFDSEPVHIKMLNDEARTRQFQSAIRQTVRPGDVVVDIGTGTGILAVTAARAGARHVYALEATGMSRVAQRMVEANGLSDRVTILQAHSFDVELPEKADVLVSEIIGDDPLGEQIVPTFADARRRLLASGARVIPARLQIRVLPLDVPSSVAEQLRFTAARAEAWASEYGLDFSGLVATSLEHDHRVKVSSYEARPWPRVAEAVTVADVDLLEAEADLVDTTVSFHAVQSGRISGVLVFFAADLGGTERLSIHPDDTGPTNSWGSVLQLFARSVDVVAGASIDLHYRFDDRGSRIELIAK